MVIGTDGIQNVEWNISAKHSTNNIVLVQGKPGTGKTTFNCHCINGASQEAIPCIIFDDSNSYLGAKDFFPKDKLTYYNVEREGIGINPFKRQVCYVDGIPKEEDTETMVYRILDVLTLGLELKREEKLKFQRSVFDLIENEGMAASMPYLYLSLEKTKLGELIRGISKPKLYSNKLNWRELLKPGAIIVVQLSDIDESRKTMFAEMILSDLWSETRKGTLGDYLLCIDEAQHFKFDKKATLHKMLRECRKYSVAIIISTQFIGGIKDRDVRLTMEQAAQRVYFRLPESNVMSIARSIDYENRYKWRTILNELQKFEYVFAGNGMVDGKAYDLKCKLRLPVSLENY